MPKPGEPVNVLFEARVPGWQYSYEGTLLQYLPNDCVMVRLWSSGTVYIVAKKDVQLWTS